MALNFLGRGVPAIARTQLLKNKAWIAGQWCDAVSGKFYPVYNPSNQQLIAEVCSVWYVRVANRYTIRPKGTRYVRGGCDGGRSRSVHSAEGMGRPYRQGHCTAQIICTHPRLRHCVRNVQACSEDGTT